LGILKKEERQENQARQKAKIVKRGGLRQQQKEKNAQEGFLSGESEFMAVACVRITSVKIGSEHARVPQGGGQEQSTIDNPMKKANLPVKE
jgi:hypothetical protein